MKKSLTRWRGFVALLMLFWLFFMVITGSILLVAGQGASINPRLWSVTYVLHPPFPPFGFIMLVLGLFHFGFNLTLFRSDIKTLLGKSSKGEKK
ncbi:MAG: hypothetical protein ACUVTO_09035 [Candidatus Caldatribacteriaceae bacterium]